MSQTKHNKLGLVSSLIISILLVACAVLVIVYRQFVVDLITVWQFKPSNNISAIVTRDSMNDYGKFLFYASRPQLESSQHFNTVCSRKEKTTSVLGCYNNGQIYIYNVTDTRIDGIKEVTSAHEMLHAAYERMNSTDKIKVNELVESEYKKLKNDKDFAELIAFYDRNEPDQRDNELHSIIGTSVVDIDPALEAHYKKYFSNRQAVVTLYVKYNGVFKDLADRSTVLSEQLNNLAKTINDRSNQYNIDVKTLDSDITTFNDRAASGDFVSQNQFYSERATLSRRIANLDATKSSIDSDIDKYNSTLAEYNTISTQSKQLYDSIDSTLVSTPSV